MAAINLTSPITDAIYASYERKQDAKDHPTLRASELGDECERRLWYKLRWAMPPKKWDGRMLRYFQNTDRQKWSIIGDLAEIGCIISKERQSLPPMINGWLTDYIDGVVVGVPSAEKTEHLLKIEFHTMASFRAWRSHGIAKANQKHMMRMQICMSALGLTRALYVGVCRDNDEIHAERVHADPVIAAQFIAKAERILNANEAPGRVSEKPEWYECKMCDFRELCHGETMARRNCRTCAHCIFLNDGGITGCSDHGDGKDYLLTEQLIGCKRHIFIPSLVNSEQIDASQDRGTITYRRKDGSIFTDGAQ